jgi:hypothetical protein
MAAKILYAKEINFDRNNILYCQKDDPKSFLDAGGFHTAECWIKDWNSTNK